MMTSEELKAMVEGMRTLWEKAFPSKGPIDKKVWVDYIRKNPWEAEASLAFLKTVEPDFKIGDDPYVVLPRAWDDVPGLKPSNDPHCCGHLPLNDDGGCPHCGSK